MILSRTSYVICQSQGEMKCRAGPCSKTIKTFKIIAALNQGWGPYEPATLCDYTSHTAQKLNLPCPCFSVKLQDFQQPCLNFLDSRSLSHSRLVQPTLCSIPYSMIQCVLIETDGRHFYLPKLIQLQPADLRYKA